MHLDWSGNLGLHISCLLRRFDLEEPGRKRVAAVGVWLGRFQSENVYCSVVVLCSRKRSMSSRVLPLEPPRAPPRTPTSISGHPLSPFSPQNRFPASSSAGPALPQFPRSIAHHATTNGAPLLRPGHRRGALAAGSPRAALRGPTLHHRAPRPPWAFRPRVRPAPPLAGAARHELRAGLVRNVAAPARCSAT